MTTKPTNPKDAIGCKKVPLSLIPSTAMGEIALAHLHGALKYGFWNWREAGVRTSIYIDAIHRHLAAYWNGDDYDPESGLLHLAHIGACINILLDARTCRKLNDDRPPKVPMAEFLERMNAIADALIINADDTELYEPLIIRAGEAACEGT